MTPTASAPPEWQPGVTWRVPYRTYTSEDIYRREQERIFGGRVWAYVGLAAEIPKPGDFRRTAIGDRQVIVARTADGRISVVENRCSHRGAQFCRERRGNVPHFTCPYHQWTYDLDGALRAVPFRRGLAQQGGMPASFDLAQHGLTRLAVTERHGVVFASFAQDVEPFEAYLGPSMLAIFDRLFDGRPLRVLGYFRQAIPANWKLIIENVKDPYHATLMHVFLIAFGLFRADQRAAVRMDAHGRHAAILFERGARPADAQVDASGAARTPMALEDPRVLESVREYAEYTNTMQTIWPNVVLQQQSNTLATRQVVTRGVNEFELVWTFFGYEDDTPELTQMRVRQANLMGPAGFVSLDDSEVMKFLADGIAHCPSVESVLEMGGRDWHDEPHIITEAALRAFYTYYRKVMDL